MQITTIGLDIAKNVFQVHGIDGGDSGCEKATAPRPDRCVFLESLSPCLIGMEACATLAPLGTRANEAGPRSSTDAGEECEGLRHA